MNHILLIEDDWSLCEMLTDLLRASAYDITACTDGESGFSYILTQAYDLVILDRMLPGMDGMSILRIARQKGIRTPILMLTALGSACEQIDGLDSGADDYLPKPFDPAVLLARIRAILRRPPQAITDQVLRCGDLSLQTAENLLKGPANSCYLSCKEAALLRLFMENYHHILPREIVLNRVWGLDSTVDDGNIGNFVYFLRKRLKEVGSRLSIRTVRGVGYRLEE